MPRVPRFHWPHTVTAGEQIELDKRTSHHISTVLRARSGEHLDLFDGEGNNARVTVITPGRRVVLQVNSVMASDTESPLHTTLLQGISRGDRMDASIQKSVELGVSAIQPVYSTHSIRPLDDKRLERKLEHWRAIVTSACEQSGRSRLPVLEAPRQLASVLRSDQPESTSKARNSSLKLILSPEGDASLGNLPNIPATGRTAIQLLIGPESGFDDSELQLAQSAGYLSTRLGPRVLRTETAGPAVLAILQARYGDLG